MPEDFAADLAASGQAEARVGVVERGLDAGFLNQIAREMLAAGRTHLVGLEERAAERRLAVLAEAIPRVRRRLGLAAEEILDQPIHCVFHAHMTGTRLILCRPGRKISEMDDDTFFVGQLAGPGTYRCETCGLERIEYALSFEIEECPCGATTFRRVD